MCLGDLGDLGDMGDPAASRLRDPVSERRRLRPGLSEPPEPLCSSWMLCPSLEVTEGARLFLLSKFRPLRRALRSTIDGSAEEVDAWGYEGRACRCEPGRRRRLVPRRRRPRLDDTRAAGGASTNGVYLYTSHRQAGRQAGSWVVPAGTVWTAEGDVGWDGLVAIQRPGRGRRSTMVSMV